jgi:hypothetical protein
VARAPATRCGIWAAMLRKSRRIMKENWGLDSKRLILCTNYHKYGMKYSCARVSMDGESVVSPRDLKPAFLPVIAARVFKRSPVGSRQPVEPPHHQHVAGAEYVEQPRKRRPGAPTRQGRKKRVFREVASGAQTDRAQLNVSGRRSG